jgi:hypothetical protein
MSIITLKDFQAVGDGNTDDSAAIQNAFNAALANGGGKVYTGFNSAKTFFIPEGIVIPTDVIFEGDGQQVTVFTSTNKSGASSNTNTVQFAPNSLYSGIKNCGIFGYQGPNPETNSLTVSLGCVGCLVRDVTAFYGFSAIFTEGIDCYFENVFAGYSTGSAQVTSNGANWWHRVKFDSEGDTANCGFLQGSPVSGQALSENHFTQCDFTGNYTSSVEIEDGNNTAAVTFFNGCVFSSPIKIIQHRTTGFSGCEFGSSINNSSPNLITIVGSYAFQSIAVSGSHISAGNINIS